MEGLQACKARRQSKTVIVQQLSGVQQGRNDTPNAGSTANSKAVITAVTPLVFTSAQTPRAPTIIAPCNQSDNTSTANVSSTTYLTTTIISTSVNMFKLPANIAITTPTRIPITHDSGNMPMNAAVRTPPTSQRCDQLLDLRVPISLSLTVAFFS